MDGDLAGMFVEADEFARGAAAGDGDGLAFERLHGRGAEGYNQFQVEEFHLLLQPPAVMLYLADHGGLAEAALAALDEFEASHSVGDVGPAAVHVDFIEGVAEGLSGGADEGASPEVFLVACLLANEGDGRVHRSFAQRGLVRASTKGLDETIRRLSSANEVAPSL